MKAVCWPGTSSDGARRSGPNYGVAPGALPALTGKVREWRIAAAPDGVPRVRLYGGGKLWCMGPHNGRLGMVE